jgi:hypothetical protein
MPVRQLSQCAHDRKPLFQPRCASNSRSMTSSSWVAAWMRAASSAIASPSASIGIGLSRVAVSGVSGVGGVMAHRNAVIFDRSAGAQISDHAVDDRRSFGAHRSCATSAA